MIIFETSRLITRKYDFERDKDHFFLLNSNEDVMRYIRPVKTREECETFLKDIIAKTDEKPGMGRWAIFEKNTDDFVGSFAIIPIEGTDDIQLGYALLKQYWGKGYASELTAAGLNYYFTMTDADHIYGVTEIPNTASQQVLLKNGFVKHSTKMEGEKELLVFIFKKQTTLRSSG